MCDAQLVIDEWEDLMVRCPHCERRLKYNATYECPNCGCFMMSVWKLEHDDPDRAEVMTTDDIIREYLENELPPPASLVNQPYLYNA